MKIAIIIICLSVSALSLTVIYRSQPEIISSNGHLILRAANNKNISFRANGSGRINLNGQDLSHIANMALNASQLIERYRVNFEDSFEKFGRVERLLEGNDGIIHRLTLLEADSKNISINVPSTGPIRNIPRLNRKVNNLERKFNLLATVINKNECNSNPCKNGGTCQDLFNSFLCHCPSEWEGPLCDKDVNECARFAGTDLGCQNGATCVNKPGTYECLCVQGWLGIHCTRRTNDCNSASSAELCDHGTCVTTNDRVGYKCICDQGWKTDGVNPPCNVDVDECNLYKPGCSVNPPVNCVNVPGSFYCGSCPQGYSGNGYYCSDINECEINNGGCSINPMVICINTRGSRQCGLCPPGYVGNGMSCSYQGICGVNNGGCHHLAQCRDNPRISPTYVECICPLGYTGNGIGISGCSQSETFNPCSSNPCVNGACLVNNVTGEYVCNCNRKYTGRNCNIRKDPCDPNPCQNGGTCRAILTLSFKCTCTAFYTGIICNQERQACGGKLRADDGILKYPALESSTYGHRISCAWTIETTNSTQVLNITFTKFNLESSRECQYDWLQIHDGRNSAAHSLGRFCGNKLPNDGVIISTHNILYLWFRSDHSVARTGFELNWKSINPVCGETIAVTTHGTIHSPGSPGNYPRNRDCYWYLLSSPGKRLLFHFFSLVIGDNSDCKSDYLEFYDSALLNNSPFAKYCNTSRPTPLYSSGPEVYIHFHSSNNTKSYPGFQITYSVVEAMPGCGGVYTMDQGEIHSPSVDGQYPPDIICEYKIKLAPNSKIKLTFLSFALEYSPACQFDSLSIHEGSTSDSPLIGTYCGTTIPAPYVSSEHEILIIFKTDWATSDTGFHLKYETVCGGVFSEPNGIIESPGYPNEYLSNKVCIFEIVQPLGKNIILSMVDFNIESNSYPECIYDYLEIRDGDNENSTLIGKYCKESPPTVISTYNYLWLKFESDTSVNGIGFRANYSVTDVGCGGILKTKVGTISTPEHPNYYPSEAQCKWVIVAPPGNVIQITWMNFHTESSYNCVYDYVSVYDNHTLEGMGGLIGKYCGNTLPPTLLSSSNIVTITFYSDLTVNLDGFLATYTFMLEENVCGGNYFTNAGIIKSPQYPENYPSNSECTWTITVQPGQQIMLNVTDFNIESYTACRYDWLAIHNGGTAASPLIGKFCGTNIPKLIPSHSNQLYLHFKSDTTKTSSGFKIFWDSATTGCGGKLTTPVGLIISPHYPKPYSRNTECFWQISVSAGSLVQVIFADIDLEPHTVCMLDYVEIYDGLNKLASSLGRFCSSSHPPYIRSTSNHLSVKFRSDISYQGRGFQLQYRTICTNKIKNFRGIIESPNFPNGYPHNQNCKWTIEVPLGNKINISFSHFELESSNVDSNCSYDYVEIKYSDKESQPDDEEYFITYGKYCGNKMPTQITLNSETAQIIFVSDIFLLGNGFRLEWQVEGCGGLLTHPNGVIQTPNYPKDYPALKECIWIIKADAGYSIQLTFFDVSMEKEQDCDYDYVKVIDGPEDSYPLLTKFCSRISRPVTVTSSGSMMYVKFASDNSYHGKGFTSNYTTVNSKCGGKFTSPNGVIHSPNYPKNYNRNDSCDWLIEVDEHHTVELKFNDVDLLEGDTACNDNYIKVYDGNSQNSTVLKKICGRQLSNKTIKSSYNNMFVEMRTHGIYTTKGFTAKYHTACGARIVTKGTGNIRFSDLSLINTEEEECSWTIISVDPSKRIHLTIKQMSVGSYCEDYYPLIIYNGESSDAPVLKKLCGTKVPSTLISDGSALHITSEMGNNFFATYSVLDSHCGGTLTSLSGYFSTSNYPDMYPVNTQCEWTLQVSPGNSVQISFSDFELVNSDDCEIDYLEIRKNNGTGELLGTYCGNDIPSNLTHLGSVWMLFKSAKGEETNGITAKGFIGEYSLGNALSMGTEHGGELNGPYGKIASPLYPDYFTGQGEFSWRITVDFGRRITIKFIELYIQSYYSECFSSYVQIYDGFDETAPSMGSYCGFNIPDPIKSISNVVYIKLVHDYSLHSSKFLLEWLEIESVSKESKTPKPKVEGCGSEEVIDMSSLKNYSLISPGYPYGYDVNLLCEWIFSTQPGSHLSIKFDEVNLESIMGRCMADKVFVYSGKLGTSDWKLKANFCMSTENIDQEIQTSNLLKVVFQSDSYTNETGFSGIIYQECGGVLDTPNGYIIFDNSTRMRRRFVDVTCYWNITVRPGRTIKIHFDKFNISYGDNNNCRNYIMLRNGLFIHSPLLGKGKYCSQDSTEDLETSGNYLSVKYVGSYKIMGFKLSYQEVSLSCGSSIMLTEIDNSTKISSPNYPNIPPPHVECSWVIMSPPGTPLRIDFEERFDLTHNSGCTKEAVEIRDGGTNFSPLIGRFCDEMPSTQFTKDNMAFINYMTDVDDPRNGFTATVSIAKCGGTIRGKTGVVRSPYFNLKSMYPQDADCTWHIVGPPEHFLTLTIEKIDLVKPSKTRNCSSVDHVTITELIKFNDSAILETPVKNILSVLCGNVIPDQITTSNNEAFVHLKTDKRAKLLDGFKLKFNASVEECGGKIDADAGVIQSPNYPISTSKGRNCQWIITVPKGRRITFTIEDFDLDYYGQGVALFNDKEYKSTIIYMRRAENNRIFKTTDNTLVVYYWTSHASFHRGFKARFTSQEPTVCVGNFDDDEEGIIKSPQNVTNFYCTWINKKRHIHNETVALKISAQFVTTEKLSLSCPYALTAIRVSTENFNSLIATVCKNTEHPLIVRSSYPTTKITVMQAIRQQNITFNVYYKRYHCGGIIDAGDGYIASPNFPNRHINETECSWLIKVSEGQLLRLNFVSINLGSDCEKSYLVIYNGEFATKPRIGKYCQNNKPDRPIQSQGSHLLIEYHLDGKTTDGNGFNITYEAISEGCGGVFNDETKLISTPSYPNDYKNNTECVWEIQVSNGLHIGLEFVDRFHIEKSSNCTNDFLEIYNWDEKQWILISKLCGRDVPKPINSTSNRMKILFRSNEKINAAGFKARWNVNCGGKFLADEKLGYIVSPGYPEEYLNNLHCSYEIATEKQFVNIIFEDFVLEQGRSDCRYDNVTIIMKYPFNTYLPDYKKVYCGNNNPGKIRHLNGVNITFHTDSWVRRRGFKFSYKTDGCGGVITEPTEITSPITITTTYSRNFYLGTTNCYWNITAPKNKIVVVRFEEFDLDHNVYCSHSFVEIYEGLTLNKTSRLAILCGNLNKNLPVVKSNNNTMTVYLRNDYTSNKLGIKAFIYFMHGPGEGCGGLVNISASDTKILRSPVLPDLDCHWQILTDKDHTIQIKIDKLKLPSCINNKTMGRNNCSCSFLEIRDGAGPFSELIEQICDNSMLLTYSTSSRNAWIRIFTTGSITDPAFKIIFTSLPSKCGQSTLTASNRTQIIQSPDFPNSYPFNIKCVWYITVPGGYRIMFHFTDFDLSEKDSDDFEINTCQNDRVEISDKSNWKVIGEGLGPETIFHGGKQVSYGEVNAPMGTHQFCGKNTLGFDYYSGYNDVKVSFFSDNLKHGKGFKLEYQELDCSRNFTELQGRLVQEHLRGHCYMTITVPANYTISLYFNYFLLFDSACKNSGLEYNDGGPPAVSTNATKLCGSTIPRPIFTKTNKIWIHTWNVLAHGWGYYDITYTSTKEGRGCGGIIYNYRGQFSSPMYPENYRSNSSCTWEIRVPAGMSSALKFTVFDLQAPCTSDYVIVTTYQTAVPSEHKFCTNDQPAILRSNNRMTVFYKTSLNNGGTGWLASFQAITEDTKLHW